MFVTYWASLVDQLVKNLPTMRETWVRSLGWEDPLEKGKATHSSILAWRIPWTIQSMGSQRVGHDWATSTQKKKRSPNSWASNYIAPVYDGAFLHFGSKYTMEKNTHYNFCKGIIDSSVRDLRSCLIHFIQWQPILHMEIPSSLESEGFLCLINMYLSFCFSLFHFISIFFLLKIFFIGV